MQYGDLVSVVIPTYNRERSIRRAVEGVLVQTYHNIEVIVVDDCSTDRTVEILRDMNDPRLRIVEHETNSGAGHARHTGIMAASGDLIAFQDSDDVWLSDKLEVQMRALEELGPEYVGIFSPEVIYGRDGEGSNKRYGPRRVACVPGPNTDVASGDLSGLFLYGNIMTLQTLLVRKSAYLGAGGFDLGLPNNEDWDFNIRLSRYGKLGFLDIPQVIVFDSPDGISKNKASHAYSTLMIFGKIKRHDPEAPSLPGWALAISRQMMMNGRPKASRRFLRRAIKGMPFKPKLYLRYVLTAFPGLYQKLVLRQRSKMRKGALGT